MYVDEYRLQGREVENNPTCTDPYCTWQADHLERTGNLVPFHGVANVGCSGYEEYKINSAVKASKHRPHKDDSPTEEAPF